MDGDVAPLSDLLELARRHGARLMVDEAHATGAVGPGGRGSVSAAGLSGEVDVVVGTLGKSLGSYGAYACANAETIDFLVNTARPFIFSTAPPPPAVGAAAAALGVLEAGPELVDRLQANARQLRTALAAEGLGVGAAKSQVVPVHVGEAEMTMDLCEAALQRGVFAQGIRPPTVPEGSCRLRCTVMATHSAEELKEAARQIGAAARDVGLAPTSQALTARVA
jgi:glycine C-acetyltransferase/8-amino-7-oxononanoate synthase